MGKKKDKKNSYPSLPNGMVFEHQCVVVDNYGHLWWIDPKHGVADLVTVNGVDYV